MTRGELLDMARTICGCLSNLGIEYTVEANDKTGTHYIYARRPYVEIRISDHRSKRRSRYQRIEVGPFGLSVEEATAKITDIAAGQVRAETVLECN